MSKVREITHEEFMKYLRENYIAYKLWTWDDVKSQLKANGFKDSEKNLSCFSKWDFEALNDCTDSDWMTIDYAILDEADNLEMED